MICVLYIFYIHYNSLYLRKPTIMFSKIQDQRFQRLKKQKYSMIDLYTIQHVTEKETNDEDIFDTQETGLLKPWKQNKKTQQEKRHKKQAKRKFRHQTKRLACDEV